jgi:hypothetical protein
MFWPNMVIIKSVNASHAHGIYKYQAPDDGKFGWNMLY